MKIYTKQGDEGHTTNILGEKFLKSHDLMELQVLLMKLMQQ